VSDREELRLAELVAALSLATDLGMGQPMEHELRTCLLAVRLGEALGLAERTLAEIYYVALLRWVGCTSHAHELAGWFDDELEAHRRAAAIDFGRPHAVLADLVRHAGAGRRPLDRAATVAGALTSGRGAVGDLFASSCEVGERLADRLGTPPGVRAAIGHAFERWDGHGWPRRLRGEAIALSTRVVNVAHDAVVFDRLGGEDAAVAVVRERVGALYDPAVALRFAEDGPDLLAGLETSTLWEAVLDAETGDRPQLDGERRRTALEAVADFVDLKSPFTSGHSRGVAALAGEAARRARLLDADVETVEHAALVHDLGRTGIPNGIWDRPGPLGDAEWERVRLHPYFTERMLARPRALAALAALAGTHHERLDGSGYHRGSTASALAPAARILAAADAYHAMTEPRPHRPARTADAAAEELRREVRAGRLDGDAVACVLAAAGHGVRRRREWPAGLTAREVEVVRLVARGLTNRQIAAELVISPRTAGHHVQHVYRKIGVSTRAAAALFAMEHDLLVTPKDRPNDR
jgi:HD-GYP domain-containing protein (c-di-GMP phosphodiesterase class II)